MEEVCISKSAIAELVKLTNEINERVEALELMGNKNLGSLKELLEGNSSG